MELTKEQLDELPDNSIVVMGCRDCEGAEEHKKVSGTWVCQWCN